MYNRKIKYLTKTFLTGLFILITLSGYCQNQRNPFDREYRPQYHFSPKNGWIGDPCDMIYYQGQYHLMWWGKAIKKDFTHYTDYSHLQMIGKTE